MGLINHGYHCSLESRTQCLVAYNWLLKSSWNISFDETKQCRLCIEIPENVGSLGYAPSSVLRLNSEKLMELGWKPDKNLHLMAKRLMESMKEQ